VDEKTRALLAAQKAPKRIDAAVDISDGGGASAAAAPSSASAWNKAGTWEEREVSAWAIEDVTKRLGELGTHALTVTGVSGVAGHASIISMRGKVKRPFELTAEIAWKVSFENEGGGTSTGKLSYTEIFPAPTGEAAAVTYELADSFVDAPCADELGSVKAEVAQLKLMVEGALAAFVDALGCR